MTRSIFDAYKDWCDDENRGKLGAQKFWNRVRNLDSQIDVDVKIAGQRLVRGVQMRKGG